MKQYIFKNTYKLVEFKAQRIRGVSGNYPYSASVIGTVESKNEEMGLGHFYLGSEILPADVERRFSPGARIKVYYNPEMSNFTVNSRTARFVSPERYDKLTFMVQARMLIRIYGPFLISLALWAVIRRHNKSLNQKIGVRLD